MAGETEIELASPSLDGSFTRMDSESSETGEDPFFSQVRDAVEGLDAVDGRYSEMRVCNYKIPCFIFFETVLFIVACLALKELAGFLGSLGPALFGLFMMFPPRTNLAESLGLFERNVARVGILVISLAVAIRTVFTSGCSEALEEYLLSAAFKDKEHWSPTLEQARTSTEWAHRSVQVFWFVLPCSTVCTLLAIREHRPSPSIVVAACVAILFWLDLISDQLLCISNYCHENKSAPIRFAQGANFVIERMGVMLSCVLIARRVQKFEAIMCKKGVSNVILLLVFLQLLTTAPVKFLPGLMSKSKTTLFMIATVRASGFLICSIITVVTTRAYRQLLQFCDTNALNLVEGQQARMFRLKRSVRFQCAIAQVCLVSIALRLGARSVKSYMDMSGHYKDPEFMFWYRTTWLLQNCIPPICAIMMTRGRDASLFAL